MLDKESQEWFAPLMKEQRARVKVEGFDIGCRITTRTIPSRLSKLLCTSALLVLLFLAVSSIAVVTTVGAIAGFSDTMRHSLILSSLAALISANPQNPWSGASQEAVPGGPDRDGKFTIYSEGIRAQFIPYGASLTNLFIKDINGVERDIVLGYDNATAYATDISHPHLGGVPGRYANRIKNSTFSVQGQLYKVKANENGGLNTLHGGPNGWDYRNFNVVAYSSSQITFSISDPDGSEGFPGNVVSYISYAVTPYQWHLRMNATADKWTPIMLSSHVYWNLDGFQNPNSPTALDHTLSMPYSTKRIAVDGILIPTGAILESRPNSVNDFWSRPKAIGTSFRDPEIKGNCGTGCSGYDNCYIVNRDHIKKEAAPPGKSQWWYNNPVASLSSAWSGIKVDVYSDQEAFQIYSCNGQNGTQPLKRTQGFHNNASRPRVTEQYGCVVMEVEDWIDGINQPDWKRKSSQIIGPGSQPYLLQASHVFSVKGGRKNNRAKDLKEDIIDDVKFL